MLSWWTSSPLPCLHIRDEDAAIFAGREHRLIIRRQCHSSHRLPAQQQAMSESTLVQVAAVMQHYDGVPVTTKHASAVLSSV